MRSFFLFFFLTFFAASAALPDAAVYRKGGMQYLGTDKTLAFVNTSKSGWFSVGHLGTPRAKGWSEWVFDYTGETPRATVNGKPVKISAEQLGKGAVGVHFRQGSATAPIFIDDLQIQRAK